MKLFAQKHFVSLVLFALALLCIPILIAALHAQKTEAADAAATDIWWPVDGVHVSGTQPFKALLQGRDVNQYQMFWEVDGGQWNWMDTNSTGYAHKEASVDLSGWHWHGEGPYAVTFISRSMSGEIIGTRTVSVYVPQGSGTVLPSVHPEQAPVTTVTPSPNPTPSSVQTSSPSTVKVQEILRETYIPPAVILPTPTPAPLPTPPPTQNPTPSLISISFPDVPLVPVTPLDPHNPLSGKKLYVDPNNPATRQAREWRDARPADALLMDKIGKESQAVWLGNWNSDVEGDVRRTTDAAQGVGATPTFVVYNIPFRDCGGYSQGGTAENAYRSWIQSISNGIGNRQAIIILEPDALSLMDCLSDTAKNTRFSLLHDAITILKSHGNTVVYLDAGHPGWINDADMANRLSRAGIQNANGFALNTSNFYSDSENLSYGTSISGRLGGAHFVIDSSRSGNGSDGNWCNPSNRALGTRPTTATGNPLLDAFLWNKTPGESDGNCNGGPSAGVWWPDYALGLAARARF